MTDNKKKMLKINKVEQVMQEHWNMKKLKRYLQNCQILKKKEKTLNEIKCHLNELKNAMISESVSKKTKITIINNNKMIKH